MKKRLMIDVDQVLTDGTFIEQIESFLGKKIDFGETGYYLQNALGKRQEEFFRLGPLNMYQDAPLLLNAYEVLERLNKVYDVYLVSAFDIVEAPYQIGNHLKYKMEYIQKKLPFIDAKQVIFSNQKNLISFDIVIDDRLKNLETGDLKLLFTSFHNHEISEEELRKNHVIRVNNWLEIANILLEGSYGTITESDC